MRNVLADLALESEAATAARLRLRRAFDKRGDAHEAAMARLLTPVAKFWICKRGSHFAQEAMECLGGNGYVEEGGQGIMARIYREMPLNSIWEGAGNIMALDLLRALRKADARRAGAGTGAREGRASGARPPGAEPAGASREMASEVEARRLAQDVALAVQARCCPEPRRRPCSLPSATRAWPATGASPSARCAPAPISTPSCRPAALNHANP
jgi:putative acyl-CoA dehydrogenase